MAKHNGKVKFKAEKLPKHRRRRVSAVVEVDEEEAVTPIGAEWEDGIFRQHRVYEKLLAQTRDARPSSNWRAELDEL